MAKPSRKTAASETRAKPANAGLPPDDDNIDKVRDILFGSQTRQIEKRLAAMEDKIDKEIASLRSESKTTLDTLEQFLRKELQTLTDQLTDERSERNESVDSLSEKIGDTKKTLEKKLSQLGDKLVKDQRETQEQILALYPELKAHVVAVPHHGSLSTLYPGFLQEFDPAILLCSCGTREQAGRLASVKPADTSLLCTAANGAATICVDKTGTVERIAPVLKQGD